MASIVFKNGTELQIKMAERITENVQNVVRDGLRILFDDNVDLNTLKEYFINGDIDQFDIKTDEIDPATNASLGTVTNVYLNYTIIGELVHVDNVVKRGKYFGANYVVTLFKLTDLEVMQRNQMRTAELNNDAIAELATLV